MNRNIILSGTDRTDWIKTISEWKRVVALNANITIYICINNVDDIDELEPAHIVLLACFIQNIFDLGYGHCVLTSDNKDIEAFLTNDVNLTRYWGDDVKEHIDSETETIFNLWHISDSGKETYSNQVHEYLKRHFFKNIDLSTVKLSMLEIFYNIFDHADSCGNSFSYMKYDKETARLHVAVCDFGKGIAKSIRDCFKDVDSDELALQKAILSMVTTQSRSHNMGMGLANILAHIGEGDTLRIVSNRAILIRASERTRALPLEFNFPGTLIFYDISLKNFEVDESYATFGLDFDL